MWPEDGEDDAEGEMTLRFVAAMIRAAYGQGYVNALSDNPPLPLSEARAREKYFWSQLPV